MDAKTTQYGSHMVMTGSQKPIRTVYINIDTRFRDDTNSSTLASYNITLPDRLLGVRSMEVVSAEIPNVIYNVSSNIGNNVFYLSYVTNDRANTKTITIPDGNYTSASTFVAAVNTQISSLDASYNGLTFYSELVTGTTYRCNFVNGETHSLHVNFGNMVNSPHERAELRGRVGWKLGFRDTNYVVGAGSGVSGESFIDVAVPKYVFLVIDDYSRSVNNSFISPFSRSVMNKNIIAKIPLSSAGASFGDVIRANFINGSLVSDTRVYTGQGVDLQKIKVELVDEFGTPVDLNEMDFSFILRLEVE